MNRTDFQQLADVRIDKAKKLLDAGGFDGAQELYSAITDNANGVLPWIKARW